MMTKAKIEKELDYILRNDPLGLLGDEPLKGKGGNFDQLKKRLRQKREQEDARKKRAQERLVAKERRETWMARILTDLDCAAAAMQRLGDDKDDDCVRNFSKMTYALQSAFIDNAKVPRKIVRHNTRPIPRQTT